MRSLSRFVALATPVTLAFTPVAQAQDMVEARTLLAVRPATVMGAAEEIGYRLVASGPLTTDTRLDAADGTYNMFFGLCEAGGCRILQLRACIAAPKASDALAGRWNNRNMLGRASVQSEGVMCIDHSLYAVDRRISLAALRSQIEGMVALLPVVQDFFLAG